MSIKDAISGVVTGIVSPIRDIVVKREDRRQAHETLTAQLKVQEDNNETTITVEKLKLEAALGQANMTTWKDEYITLTFGGIINATILGGILHGFGYPEFLQGVMIGTKALTEIGLDLGAIVTTVVIAAVGVTGVRKMLG